VTVPPWGGLVAATPKSVSHFSIDEFAIIDDAGSYAHTFHRIRLLDSLSDRILDNIALPVLG